MAKAAMKLVSPGAVLAQIAEAIPAECRENLIIIGSLAKPILTPLGIYIAQPKLMALANLLEHPEIRPETMSGLIAGRELVIDEINRGNISKVCRGKTACGVSSDSASAN